MGRQSLEQGAVTVGSQQGVATVGSQQWVATVGLQHQSLQELWLTCQMVYLIALVAEVDSLYFLSSQLVEVIFPRFFLLPLQLKPTASYCLGDQEVCQRET